MYYWNFTFIFVKFTRYLYNDWNLETLINLLDRKRVHIVGHTYICPVSYSNIVTYKSSFKHQIIAKLVILLFHPKLE